MNISEAKSILEELGAKTTVMLWGPPGVGKSAIVREIADEHKIGFIDLRLTLLNPVDLRGFPVPYKEQNMVRWLPPEFLPRSGRGILFLDEINVAAQSVQAAAYQLVLDRRIGEYVLPDGWHIIAAGNRSKDKGLTYKMPAPLANRMIHFEIEADLDSWKDWAYKKGINPSVISFLSVQPQLLYSLPDVSEVRAFPSPRTWEMVSNILKLNKNPELRFYEITGAVGEGTAATFDGFLRVFEKIPDPEKILSGEITSMKEKSSHDILWGVSGALANRLAANHSDERMEIFFSFVTKNFPMEFQVLAVKEAIKGIGMKNLNLGKIKNFNEWAKKNARGLI